MENNDLDLFRKEMADVEPLNASENAGLRKSATSTPGQVYRRQAATHRLEEENFLPSSFTNPVHPYDILSFKRDGVQHGVFRKLKRGEYPIEATLNLYRCNAERARNEVYHFIVDCFRLDIRTMLILHGIGAHRQQTSTPIKGLVAAWLPLFPEVLAFHSAQRHHGGVASVYILLRKSENQKEINRRRFGLSR